tara:strand:+ start:1520 stop:2116 length:597 start_codon:yes stop_codon:yes gene_type:complete
MKPPCMELGSFSNEMLSEDWVLFFGGLELNSVGRAATAVKLALEKNYQVVFFNPKEEQIDSYLLMDFSQEYTSSGKPGTKFTTVDCFNEIQKKPLSKYADTLKGSLNGVESLQVGYQAIFLQTLPLSLRRAMSAVVSKIHTLCRGFIFWRVVKEQILKIAGGIEPKIIFYCGEDSIAPAWNAAQIWKDADVKAYWEVI